MFKGGGGVIFNLVEIIYTPTCAAVTGGRTRQAVAKLGRRRWILLLEEYNKSK